MGIDNDLHTFVLMPLKNDTRVFNEYLINAVVWAVTLFLARKVG